MISVIASTINPDVSTLKFIYSVLRGISHRDEFILHVDPSEEIYSSWEPKISDSRLTVLRSSSRIGFAEGLNLAANQARHALLGRIDADDLPLPGRWSYQIKAMGDLDVHFGSLLHSYSGKAFPCIIPHYPVALNPTEFQTIASQANPGFHPSALIRRASFEKLGGYHDVKSEDYDLWLRALRQGMKLRRGLRPVTLYRHHAGQATANKDWARDVASDPVIIEGQTRLAQIHENERASVDKVLSRLAIKYPLARVEFRQLYRP